MANIKQTGNVILHAAGLKLSGLGDQVVANKELGQFRIGFVIADFAQEQRNNKHFR